MSPETNATATVAGVPQGHKGGKAAGKNSDLSGPDAGGFGALLALQGDDGGEIPESASAGAGEAPVSSPLPDPSQPVALDTTKVTGGLVNGEPPIDMTFLLSQTGALTAPNKSYSGVRSVLSSSAKLPVAGIGPGAVQSDPMALTTVGQMSSGKAESAVSSEANKEPRLADSGQKLISQLDVALAKGQGQSPTEIPAPRAELTNGAATQGGSGRESRESALADAQIIQNDAAVRAKMEDLRTARLANISDKASRTATVEPIMVRSAFESTALSMERPAAKSPADAASPAAGGGFGPQLRFSADMIESKLNAGGSEMQSPETYVAEQVKYLITHDMQSAELKLKGFDDLPIDVHISMNGKDAQVDFRTDHVEIREILQGAETHLKDMLAREGLVLSGVSVGTSMSDGADPRAGQQAHFMRQQVIIADDIAPVTAGRTSAPRSGSAVDVFV